MTPEPVRAGQPAAADDAKPAAPSAGRRTTPAPAVPVSRLTQPHRVASRPRGYLLVMPPRMLSCPHCGIVKPASAKAEEVEYCPRCLARSGGALSVFLSEAKPSRRGSPRLAAGRLLRLGRGSQWART